MTNPFNTSQEAAQEAASAMGSGSSKPSTIQLSYKSGKTAKDYAQLEQALTISENKAGFYKYVKSEVEGEKGASVRVLPFTMVLLKTLIKIKGNVPNSDKSVYTQYDSTYIENTTTDTFKLFKRTGDKEKDKRPIFEGLYADFKEERAKIGLGKEVGYTKIHFVLDLASNQVYELEGNGMLDFAIENSVSKFTKKKASSLFIAPKEVNGIYYGFFSNGSFSKVNDKGEDFDGKTDLYFVPNYQVGTVSDEKILATVKESRGKIDEWLASRKKSVPNVETPTNSAPPMPEDFLVGDGTVASTNTPPTVTADDDLPF